MTENGNDSGIGLPERRLTRAVMVGPVQVGGGAPVSIQSMTNTDPCDASATRAQIRELAASGCEIVRVAVPDAEAARVLPEILARSPIPVIADIHFDARLALAAIDAGVHGVRINPGTLGKPAALREVAVAAAQASVPVRIGINGGSIEREILARFGGATPAAMVESALRHCRQFEDWGCSALKVSLKSSAVTATVAAYRQFAAVSDYPLHIGVTEAGTARVGTIKSAVGLGALLLAGLGDTLRVSLTAPPVQEVHVARQILEAAGRRVARPELVSCPTCGRTAIDLVPIAAAVEAAVDELRAAGMTIDLGKVAIMGCVVNGPGEARDADLGIAGGCGEGVLFKHGKIVRKLPEAELLPALLKEIRAHAHRK